MQHTHCPSAARLVVMTLAVLGLACSELETGGMPNAAGGAGGVGSGGSGGTLGGSSGVGGTSGVDAGGSGGASGASASGGSGGSGGSGADACVEPGGNDPSACGPDCRVCPAPLLGIASCIDQTCGASCEDGWHACGSPMSPSTWECTPNDALRSCGDRCEPCPEPEGATATCIDSACGFECDDERIVCPLDAACGHARWSFEDGTVQGFELRPEDSSAVSGAISVSTDHAYEGTQSLRVPFSLRGVGRMSVHVALCESGGMDLRGRMVRMMVRFEETTSAMPTPYAGHIQADTTATGLRNLTNSGVSAGEWTFHSDTFDDTASEVLGLGFYVYADHEAEGFLYIDDIAIE